MKKFKSKLLVNIIKVSIFILITIPVITFVKNKKIETTLKIGFGGDVMLGRLVNEQISNTNYKYPWGNLIKLMHKTDINIVNLETTLTTSTKIVPKVFNFKADPDKVESLKSARIDIVNLANNHILDFSTEGMIETIETLDKFEIKHIGAGMNEEEARKPVIIQKKGIRIGILGYTDNEPDWKATPSKPGTNYIKVGDITKIKEDINKLRNKVDILIVTIHWGPNMQQEPTQEFVNFAHQIIDLGVDILHGHSSHIFQPIEIYKNKLILYDTGDLVDDYRVDPILRNDQSFFYIVTISKKEIKEIKLIPVLISNMQVNLAKNNTFQEIAKKIKNLSEKLGTKVSFDKEELKILN